MSESVAVVIALAFVWLACAVWAFAERRAAERGRENRPKWRRYFGGLAIKGWHGVVADHLYMCDLVWTRVF